MDSGQKTSKTENDYIMGTKCLYKDGFIQNHCPCWDLFWSPWGKLAI